MNRVRPGLGAAIAALLCLILLSEVSAAQQRGTEIVVKVTFQHNDRPVTEGVRVQLINDMGMTVSETYSRNGEARFPGVTGIGPYRLKAIGSEIEEGQSAIPFNIPPGAYAHTEYLRLRLKPKPGETAQPAQGSISASALNVPPAAKKEYEKGLKAFRSKKLAEAQKYLEAAVEIYPNYAAALNNLGIISQMSGDSVAGDAYFEKAIARDDAYPNAYINLAKSRMVDKRLAEAEKLLLKYSSLEPGNMEAPTLLVNLYVVTGKHDEAEAIVKRMHAARHDGFEVVHFLLGASYQTRNDLPRAADEYRAYLKESPDGPNSQAVRNNLLKIEQQLATK